MMNKLKKIVAVLMALILLGVPGNKISGVKVFAADNTLKICMGESNTARHHKAVALGEETEELRFVLKEGSAKSSSYISSNPSCFKIKNTTEGKCIVEALAISEETTMIQNDEQNREDETIGHLLHKVTFIDKERNTTNVVNVQHNRVVEKLSVSQDEIKYKGKKKQKFVYWAIKKDGKLTKYDFTLLITNDIKLYAVYAVVDEPIEKNTAQKKVIFDSQNGKPTLTLWIDTKKIDEPVNPEKRGYIFIGWYTKVKEGKKWDFKKDEAYSQLTLYAHWKKIKSNSSYYISPKTGYDFKKVIVIFFLGLCGTGTATYKIKKKE